MSLTQKQKKFVDNLLKSGNPQKAARSAGYSEKTIEGGVGQILDSQGVQNLLKKKLTHLIFRSDLNIFQLLTYSLNTLLEGFEDGDLDTRLSLSKYIVRIVQELRDIYGFDYLERTEEEIGIKHKFEIDEDVKDKLFEKLTTQATRKEETGNNNPTAD